MHPNHAHGIRHHEDPEAALERRLEVARQSGVPPSSLQRYAERAREMPSGVAKVIEPDRDLVPGVQVETDLGLWEVYETPGHAPSHVCLFQPERRVLISGDHLLGRISLYYDYGWTPDPAGEFLKSLDVVDRLDARLCLSGHGKPFTDVPGHVHGNRRLVAERLDAVRAAVSAAGPLTVVEVVPQVYGQPLSQMTASWWLAETLCYLRHLEVGGEVIRTVDGDVERWGSSQP
jgi:glyoxylase-like metal-dependent hydrolase (beta-lactamase superfamily II)